MLLEFFWRPSSAVMKWNTFFFWPCIISCTFLQAIVLTDASLHETTRSDWDTSLVQSCVMLAAGGEGCFLRYIIRLGIVWLMSNYFNWKKKNVLFSCQYQPSKGQTTSALHFVLSVPIKTSSASCCPCDALLFSEQQSVVQTQVNGVRKKESWFECNKLGFLKIIIIVIFCSFPNPWKD